MVGANCLHRSIVLWWLLRRQGVACHIRFGVRKGGTALRAHAWVEHRDTVLNDAGKARQHYVSISRYPVRNAELTS